MMVTLGDKLAPEEVEELLRLGGVPATGVLQASTCMRSLFQRNSWERTCRKSMKNSAVPQGPGVNLSAFEHRSGDLEPAFRTGSADPLRLNCKARQAVTFKEFSALLATP